MPDVDEIIERLCGRQSWRAQNGELVVTLANAEAAVRDTRDATVKEIVEWMESKNIRHLAGVVARRFPNGGTNDV